MSTLLHYDLNDWIYITRGDGNRSKRYKHWCLQCKEDRGYAYKNKILKESFCQSCRMKHPDVIAKISNNSSKLKHSTESRQKISKSLYARYGSNPLNRKIAINLRGRFAQAVRNNYKNGSAVKDLGCSIEDFRRHIESLWQPDMSWENYGRKGWHIDHILPLCKFDLTDNVQLKKACHYTNLQPLWASQNLEKRKTDGTFRKPR